MLTIYHRALLSPYGPYRGDKNILSSALTASIYFVCNMLTCANSGGGVSSGCPGLLPDGQRTKRSVASVTHPSSVVNRRPNCDSCTPKNTLKNAYFRFFSTKRANSGFLQL